MARNTPTPGQKISYFLVILLGVFLLYLDINTNTFNGIKNGFSSFENFIIISFKKYSIDQITELSRLFKSKDHLSRENKILKEQLDQSYLNNFVISREKIFFMTIVL